ncbi:DUF4394 domain-containing protein [Spirosoma rhododendri]|uniref:DUF4394 domain-containing protein n=1 Tax=Spirosoma rhododendri TaxID=2728024 RepID=A0A7L5DKQ2_9BACT|nr:DUF4394 domain-containing protein [Spirosoma rhododendri]QJD78081.1 DUF4394 domain-containing protein [Spirosoma rhododendri]
MFTKKQLRFSAGMLAIGSLLSLNACQDRQMLDPQGASTTANARLAANFDFYALTDNNRLLKMNTGNPSVSQEMMTITGVLNNERLTGIDFRPATGQLYAISNGSRLYTINLRTGAAVPVGSAALTPGVMGDAVGFDFNPTVDRIRLVSNRGQNLRLNPETGAVMIVDGPINGVAGASVSGVAYSNNRSGVTTTTLYDIDPVTDKLYRQNPPNDGGLVEVGPLGVDVAGQSNFDIAPDGSAIATMISNGVQGLYEINLTTGRAELLGNLPSAMSIVGMAIPTEHIAYVADGMNMLHYINLNTGATHTVKAITGLQTGETLRGIDMRPVNGQLYALGTTNRIYTINMASGAATAVGAPISTGVMGDVGFDFNPTVDRIRIVSNDGQNLRYNPNDNSVIVDGRLNPGSPNVTAAAYTNNFPGATSTTLYDIDSRTGNAMLYRQIPPNNGGLELVGSLGRQIEGGNGFDIGGTSNVGHAALRVDGITRLYTINLTTGVSTERTALAGNPSVRGFAVGLGF